MTDNQELGRRLRDFMVTHKEQKFTREELWAAAFAGDADALGVDSDTQRRAIGRAREQASGLGGYITHAVAANGYTYTWTELAENGIDPTLHYTKIVMGQEDVLEGIKKFVQEIKTIKATDKSAEIELIVQLAESAQTHCELARRNLEKATNFLIERRRNERRSKVST